MDIFLPPSRHLCSFFYKKLSRTIPVAVVFFLLIFILTWTSGGKSTLSQNSNSIPAHRRRIQFAASSSGIGIGSGNGIPVYSSRQKFVSDSSGNASKAEDEEQFNLPILHSPNGDFSDMPKITSPDLIEMSQLTVLRMADRGFKLSVPQKKILDGIPELSKNGLRERMRSNRAVADRMYFEQLRKKDLIRKLSGGGEYIISAPRKSVRFPMSLKKKDLDSWTAIDKLFLNTTHYPWPDKGICQNFSVSFAPLKSLTTSALASFPSSGNTWVRYLVESASGIYTGSMYDDSSLVRKGMYGEAVPFDSGMTILVKSHGYTTGEGVHLDHSERIKYNHMNELNRQGVLVIRNPFKALISHRNLDVGGHTGYAPKHHFEGKGWRDFLSLKIMLWRDFCLDWLSACRDQDLHVVFYEDLQFDAVAVVRGMLKFLKIHIDEERLKCLSKQSEGGFKRKPPTWNVINPDPIPADMKQKIREAIRDVNNALLSKGKKTLPVDRYEMFDNFEDEQQRIEELKAVI